MSPDPSLELRPIGVVESSLVLSVHPRGDAARQRQQQGVFSTRSPHRPNPVGLHRVEIIAIDGPRMQVRHLEALNGTPIIDVKPVLSENIGER